MMEQGHLTKINLNLMESINQQIKEIKTFIYISKLTS